MKKLIALLLALTMVLSMAACGTETPETTAPKVDPAETTQPVETTVPPTTEPEVVDNTLVEYYMKKANEVVVTDTHVTFTDDSGRGEISIEKNPQNAAILYGSLTCLWYEAGGTAQLAIGGKSNAGLYEQQIGRSIAEDEGVTVVAESNSGTQWDVETIIAQKPDLIVVSMGMKGYETIGAVAEAAGIPIIGIQYDHVQDYLKWFKVFCNLNGQPELWDEIANASAEKIIEVISQIPEEVEAPRVLALSVTDSLKAYGTEAAVGTILYELGAYNVADNDPENTFDSVDIDLEQIYAMDPDIIVVVNRSTDGSTQEKLEELVGSNEVWLNLDAVKEGKLYYLDMRLFFNKPNWRYQEAYQIMAQILYPETFGAYVAE